MTIQELINQLQTAIKQGHDPDTSICVYERSNDPNFLNEYSPCWGLEINGINPFTAKDDKRFIAINFYEENDDGETKG